MTLSLSLLLLAYSMTLYLFCVAFYEAIKFSSEKGKVKGGLFLFSFTFGLIFTQITCLLTSYHYKTISPALLIIF